MKHLVWIAAVPLALVAAGCGNAPAEVQAVATPSAATPAASASASPAEPPAVSSAVLGRLRVAAQHVQAVAEAEGDVFGGVAIDAPAHVVRVFLTDISDEVTQRFVGSHARETFAFQQVRYPMNQLRQIQAQIGRDRAALAAEGIDVNTTWPSEYDNLVMVGIRSMTEDQRRRMVAKYVAVEVFEDNSTFMPFSRRS